MFSSPAYLIEVSPKEGGGTKKTNDTVLYNK